MEDNAKVRELVNGMILRDRPTNGTVPDKDAKFMQNGLDLPKNPFTKEEVAEARAIWARSE